MSKSRTMAVIALAGLALAGCGNKRELRPVAGQVLPPAPYGSENRPTAADLVKRPTQAGPERSVELRTRSQAREDDPFDLPPEH